MDCYYIIGLRLASRVHNAVKLQEVLTKSGCNIKTRLGLHETDEKYCSNDGLIIIQACGTKAEIDDMMTAFNEIEGITAKLMDLN
ncbi:MULTISPECIES: hypothetical protein [Breznakia]|uniref:Uncharacterized protein n=1 Tax=Breznakia blatticola TaxID=1754012 RepID=A0A4R7ZC32_9FIRM|nr:MULTISPECIES: hypothetical protein [Breznakia]MDH6367275.1 hypothetical protein [Breznakia sp. PH1-1]MDH6404454.1 hypothetical protein [Breznakia sp. PF1-11]MDH6412155.1 hypothetical protein [Breznakia sp. PFB1-11]MDH6414442.1 hypothetical protein [Breznakia sp. PFB1-14]MDH6416827.1 hypothetical protein [Breznakia sp. PFB1-4]